jgi:lysophospholipase L1-like esterase
VIPGAKVTLTATDTGFTLERTADASGVFIFSPVKTFMTAAGIPVDDQHALMVHHTDQHEDNVHFNAAGAAVQGQQVAQSIRTSLAKQ